MEKEMIKMPKPLKDKGKFIFLERGYTSFSLRDIGKKFKVVDTIDIPIKGKKIIDLKKLDKINFYIIRTTGKSVFLTNFIGSEFGSTKIYKAKKRLELRLRPKMWIENNLALKITTSFTASHVDLRKEKVHSDYLKKQIEKLKGIKVDFIQ